MIVRAVFCILLVLPLAAFAEEQDLEAVRATVAAFVASQTAALPGTAVVAVAPLDPRLRLKACANLQPALPMGAKLWGSSTVTVRCVAPEPWAISVPVSVKVMANVIVAALPLPAGHVLTTGDVASEPQDLTRLPAGVLLDPQAAVGQKLKASVAKGVPLRSELFSVPMLIQQGQTVTILFEGAGFHVSSEGRALTGGGAGQVVQVRAASGKILRGIAKSPGVVEVR